MPDLNQLKKAVFQTDNKACFIERERILHRLKHQMKDYSGDDKYALVFSELLNSVSTPLSPHDYFAGRVLEGVADEGTKVPDDLLYSLGHMSPDYPKILRMGFCGILDEIKETAFLKGDSESMSFYHNAKTVVEAIRDYCLRYCEEAEKYGFEDMANALKKVPYEPAYDFYSALQAIWIIHMIASCYVGSRDYAFGRFDSYMLPFYQKAIADGKTVEELTELLAGFMIKTNEICGTSTYNYNTKPIHCQASKQYINIGGKNPNEFSKVVLDAAVMCNMAQPQIVVLLDTEGDRDFVSYTFEALSKLTDKMNIYNYRSVCSALIKNGLPEDIAKDFTYSACCTFDLNYHSFRLEYYVPAPQLFVETLQSKDFGSIEQIAKEYTRVLQKNIQLYADNAQKGFDKDKSRKLFVLDSILLSDSAEECRYACDGKAKYNVINVFYPGMATIGDSLMVIDKIVFKEKRYTYREFIDIIHNNFENNEALYNEIKGYTKFGNDTEADTYTVIAANAFLDATDNIKLKDNFMIAPGFYSLERDNNPLFIPEATPDGRKHGEPFSENQSPSYGADKNGVTALLKSLSKLPFDKTFGGGLNLTFGQSINPKILEALITSYFRSGGIHTGITVIDKDILRDAMKNPQKYQTLTVRLYGFSEYFVSLPKWQQIAVLNRTEYNT